MSRPRIAVVIQRSAACEALGSDALPADVRVHAWIRAAAEDAASGEITVRFVDEAESAALNANYRDRDYATNVLSFPAEPLAALPFAAPPGEPLPLGDLVACVPVVVREAAEQGKALEAHWAHILMHGCLHLFGYDHVTDPQAETMEARERALLGRFGFPDPYMDAGGVLASDSQR